jgi:hypothetical protein
MKNFNNEQYNKPNYSVGRITDLSSTAVSPLTKNIIPYQKKKLPIKYITQHDIDTLQSQINKLKGELIHLKDGFSREDEFYKKLINNKTIVTITLQNELIVCNILENYKYGLLIRKEDTRRIENIFIQKVNIIYLSYQDKL